MISLSPPCMDLLIIRNVLACRKIECRLVYTVPSWKGTTSKFTPRAPSRLLSMTKGTYIPCRHTRANCVNWYPSIGSNLTKADVANAFAVSICNWEIASNAAGKLPWGTCKGPQKWALEDETVGDRSTVLSVLNDMTHHSEYEPRTDLWMT